MKVFYTLLFAAIVSVCVFSCSKTKVTPSNNSSQADTSTAPIDNIALVGKWNILTDTVSYAGSNTMYHGVATDHYTFTKYGNLYVNIAQNNFTDTAIYAINSLSYSVSWQNISYSINGTLSRLPSTSSAYAITSLDADTLILTSNAQTNSGARYEQIVFRKQ
jgi:hypothetical protein